MSVSVLVSPALYDRLRFMTEKSMRERVLFMTNQVLSNNAK
jgi:hypothetical protein